MNLNPRSQAEAFIAALLRAAPAVPVQLTVIRRIGTGQEQALRKPHVVRNLDDLGRLWGWLRAENGVKDANVYVRPDPGQPHSWLFLDDVPPAKALAVARKYRALVVETSIGNAQIRLLADRPLPTRARAEIQTRLAGLIGADPGSTAGDKWGRLPGFTNRKPGKVGQWTNLLADSTASAPPYAPEIPPEIPSNLRPHLHPRLGAGAVVASPLSPPRGRAAAATATDGDESIREFAYACAALRAGVPPDVVAARIAEHVSATGRRKSADYPLRTVLAAQARLHNPGL